MFDPCRGAAQYARLSSGSSYANWEDDVFEVTIENCAKDEDPSGMRVLYHKMQDADFYTIGASHLSDRLKRLSRAGYEAPMTRKAINMIDQKRLKILKTVA